jgi:predicted DNA-binding transcriptional regulator AlpA
MRQEIRVENASALDEKQVAQLINVSVALLRKWRRGKDGPRWVKLGGRAVRYLAKDVEAWLETCVVATRSTQSGPR